MAATIENPKLQVLLSRLKQVTTTSNGWEACCPSHDDTRPSLSIHETQDGTILLKCQSAGCHPANIMQCAGLSAKDMFPPRESSGRSVWGELVTTYDYRDENDVPVFQVCRFEKVERQADGTERKVKTFRQRHKVGDEWVWKMKGVRRVLYRLPQLLAAKDEPVFLVEGEKQVDFLRSLGLCATCNPQGAGKWRDEFAESLRGRDIIIVPDNDPVTEKNGKVSCVGMEHAESVADSLTGKAATVHVLSLPGMEEKWGLDDWLQKGGHSLEELEELIANATPWVRGAKLFDRTNTDPDRNRLLRDAAVSQTGRSVLLPVGTRVRAKDRDNFGEVVRDDGGDTVRVHFTSPDGQQATKDIPRKQLARADGSSVVPSDFKLKLIPSREFAAADYRQRFLIRNVLTEGQPCIVGGPRKGMKTGTLIELAVSLGSATPFFGCEEFAVKETVNVAVLSGESGLATLQETARRIAFAHKVELADCRIWWETRLPQIANPEHCDALQMAIREHEIKACIIDPAYLCLLSGDTQGRQASNVFDMGSILQGLATVGLNTGCGIIMAHHTRKNPTDRFAIPDLDELAFAGFGEFARQWILLNRRKEYELGSGRHDLWLSIGGSAGHSSCWSLSIEEGVPDEEFRGRYWQTSVRPASEAIQQARDDRERQKENDRNSRMLADLERLADLMRNASESMTKNEMKERLALNGKNFDAAFAEALRRNLFDQTTKKAGNGQSYPAYVFHSDTQTSA